MCRLSSQVYLSHVNMSWQMYFFSRYETKKKSHVLLCELIFSNLSSFHHNRSRVWDSDEDRESTNNVSTFLYVDCTHIICNLLTCFTESLLFYILSNCPKCEMTLCVILFIMRFLFIIYETFYYLFIMRLFIICILWNLFIYQLFIKRFFIVYLQCDFYSRPPPWSLMDLE